MPVTKSQAHAIALSFEGATEKLSYGKPAFFIGKKFFARLRGEDHSIVMIVSAMEQRDLLLEMDPETYFITDHYRNYPVVLVRLSKISPGELKTMLRCRFERIAPKKLLQKTEEMPKPVKRAARKRVPANIRKGAKTR